MTPRKLLPLTVLLFSGPAFAGGQYVGDNGSQGMQRGGAFAAKADDPTALYYNPAGLVNSNKPQLFFGLNFVSLEQSFQRAGEYQPQTVDPGEAQPDYVGDPYPLVEHDGETQPIPFIAVTIPVDRYAFGFGVFAPHGYGGRNFPTTVRTEHSDEAPAPQRYDAVSQTGLIVFPSAGAAVRVSDRVNVGVRASWTYARIKSTKYVQGVPNRGEEPGRDTAATIDAKDPFTLAYALGFHFRKSESFEFAASYAGPIKMHAKGTSVAVAGADLQNVTPEGGSLVEPVPDSEARCEPGGTPDNIKACVDLSLPQTGTVGMRWIARNDDGEETGDIEVDVRWENWSAASEYRVVIDGRNGVLNAALNDTVIDYQLRDVYSIRAGASTTMIRDDRRYHFSGGVSYDTEATPVNWTSLNVDGGSRLMFAGGVGVSFSSTRLDLGLAHISSSPRTVQTMQVTDPNDVNARQQPDAPVPLLPPESLPHHPINAGVYESRYTIISAGLTRSF